jgi:hypothetical protein
MMAHEVDCELAGDDAQVIWTCKDTMRVYEDDLTDNAKSFKVSLQVQITCASSPANSQSTSCAIIKGLTS